MPRKEGLLLLKEMEDDEAGRSMLNEEELAWWRHWFPNAPDAVLAHMKGLNQSPGQLPWNRRLRRSHHSGKGVILHLFSGPDVKKWMSVGGQDYRVLCVDPLLGTNYDLHNMSVWSYLWDLCSRGLVSHHWRSSAQDCFKPPGPRRLRGRAGLRWGGLRV